MAPSIRDLQLAAVAGRPAAISARDHGDGDMESLRLLDGGEGRAPPPSRLHSPHSPGSPGPLSPCSRTQLASCSIPVSSGYMLLIASKPIHLNMITIWSIPSACIYQPVHSVYKVFIPSTFQSERPIFMHHLYRPARTIGTGMWLNRHEGFHTHQKSHV